MSLRKTTSNHTDNNKILVTEKPSKQTKSNEICDDNFKGQTHTAITNHLKWNILFRKISISFSILILVYIYHYMRDMNSSREYMRSMATTKDNLIGSPIGMILKCSDDYLEDKSIDNRECVPKKCGRFIGDSIVTDKESLELRLFAERIFSLIQQYQQGGVSIFDITSGALSNGTQFINLYKYLSLNNKPKHQIIQRKNIETFQIVKAKIIQSISLTFGIDPTKIYLTSPAFFTRIDSKQDKTLNDQYWHEHVDKKTYDGFHYTSLLYLATYGEEFNGGRFTFLDDDPSGRGNGNNITVEPKFNRVLYFTSGNENRHMVEKVTSGTRFALTIPFTCDQNKQATLSEYYANL